MSNNPTIIVIGNPVDGFHFYGPFNTEEQAFSWANSYELDDAWCVARLNAPKSLTPVITPTKLQPGEPEWVPFERGT